MNLLPRGDDRFHSQSMDGSRQRLYVGSETTLAEVQAQLQMRHRDACVGFMGVRQEQAARKHHEAWGNGSVQCHFWAGAAPAVWLLIIIAAFWLLIIIAAVSCLGARNQQGGNKK